MFRSSPFVKKGRQDLWRVDMTCLCLLPLSSRDTSAKQSARKSAGCCPWQDFLAGLLKRCAGRAAVQSSNIEIETVLHQASSFSHLRKTRKFNGYFARCDEKGKKST